MKIKGFLALLILVLALVYFLWIAKGRRQDQTVEEFEAFNEVKFKLTKVNMTTLQRAIVSFIAKEGRTPKSLKGLQTFHVLSAERLDAWGAAIKYERLSDINFRLISAGRDRVFNTQDDIILDY
ncbi:MAG: hypothetical protein ACE5WD_01860 [Candidatus Aminicenantia bacterium]